MPTGNAGNYKETADDKSEEGGDEVKSSRPLWVGLHTCYNDSDNGMRSSDAELILQNLSKFGLQAATRLHKAGIASNRGSAIPR